MNYSLMFEDVESALAKRPEGHARSLDDFSTNDEIVLALFLLEEANNNPVRRKYDEWSVFVKKDEQKKHPKNDIIRRRENLPLLENTVHKLLLDHQSLSDTDIDQNMVDVFTSIPGMAQKALEWQTQLYESILANIYTLNEESGAGLQTVISKLENRDEVFRRVFPKKELFDFYNAVQLKTGEVAVKAGFLYAADVSEKFDDLMTQCKEDHGLVGSLLVSCMKVIPKYKKGFDAVDTINATVPPAEVVQNYFEDQVEYMSMRSEKIYGPKK